MGFKQFVFDRYTASGSHWNLRYVYVYVDTLIVYSNSPKEEFETTGSFCRNKHVRVGHVTVATCYYYGDDTTWLSSYVVAIHAVAVYIYVCTCILFKPRLCPLTLYVCTYCITSPTLHPYIFSCTAPRSPPQVPPMFLSGLPQVQSCTMPTRSASVSACEKADSGTRPSLKRLNRLYAVFNGSRRPGERF